MSNTRPTAAWFAAVASAVLLAGTSFAEEIAEIVVEAKAPVGVKHLPQKPPGGMSVDLLSVKYRVLTGNLDLTKHSDVLKLEDQIKVAAQKACDSIAAQYPTRSMSDAQTCVKDAVEGTAAQEKDLIAAAEKAAKK
jgi:UrcA family protein